MHSCETSSFDSVIHTLFKQHTFLGSSDIILLIALMPGSSQMSFKHICMYFYDVTGLSMSHSEENYFDVMHIIGVEVNCLNNVG